eukprot:jgi/Ulvmu1/5190/UM021_0207.1
MKHGVHRMLCIVRGRQALANVPLQADRENVAFANMLEPVLSFYLNKYLGKYVTGLDSDKLRVSVWAGDVVLKDLQLRAEALQDLNLPITVKGGVLGTLRLKIPWAALGRQQVQVEIDRLYLLAIPSYQQDALLPEDMEHEEERLADVKRAEVHAQEKQWVDSMRAADHVNDSNSPGYLQGVINVVLGNLKIKVTNLHIRYEDTITQHGHPFAFGITLHSIGAFTVDDAGNEMFIKHAAMSLLRKASELSRFAVYFDTDVESLLHEEHKIHQWSTADWDTHFTPGIADDKAVKLRQYVLNPVDGDATYVRRATELVGARATPHQEINMDWPEFALRLSHLQALNVTLLLQELSRHQLRLPHSMFRPSSRPAGAGARLWWRYALKAVTNRLRQGRPTWWDLARYLTIQREYVPLYVQHLRSGTASPNARISDLDRELPKEVILHFRKLAHARIRKLEQAQQSKGDTKQQQQQNRTWVQWMGFGTAVAASIASGEDGDEDQAREGDKNENERAYLTDGEVQALEDMVQAQASVIESSDPLQLLTRIAVTVNKTSVCLVDSSGTVATMSAAALKLTHEMYQVEAKATCSIGSSALVSPGCNIIQTGALSDQDPEFLLVEYTQNPHSQNVDHDVSVRMAPSYVTYDVDAVARIQQFFIMEEQQILDLTALGAQAATRIREMQAIAQQQMHAAWSNRPKIHVHLDLHAPKIAIPIVEEQDNADPAALQTLFVDFGSLVITSNHLEGSSLSPEEAAIYDCYGLLSYDTAVYVIKGPFVWPELTRTLSGSITDVGLASPAQLNESRSRTAGGPISDYLGPSAIAVPLLGHCSTTASVHVAHVSHPTLPLVRVGLEVPEITLHVSPYRLTQLLLVMQALMPTTDAPTDPAPWVKAAEYTSTVDVLAWQGIAGASSQWQPRFAVVYRGTLYIMQSEGSPVIMRQVALWQGRRVLPLPEDLTGGVSSVLAVLPSHIPRERAVEEVSAVILRLQSDYMLQEWTRRLRHSAAQMHSVAVWHSKQEDPHFPFEPSLKDSSTMPSLTNSPPASAAALSEDHTAGADSAFSPNASVYLRVSAHLGRLALHVSARAADEFWPPLEVSQVPIMATADRNASLLTEVPEDIQMIGDERPLISIVAEGGLLRYQQGLGTMEMRLRLQRFIIEDRLVGAINKSLRFLARSFLHADAADTPLVGGELSTKREARKVVVDSAAESSANGRADASDSESMHSACSDMVLSGHLSGVMSSAAGGTTGILPSVMPLAAVEEAVDGAAQSLAVICFNMWDAATSPSYENVDMALDVSVSALYFLCNRPTIAALMCFAQDIVYPEYSAAETAGEDFAEAVTPRGISAENSGVSKTPPRAEAKDGALPHLSPNTAQDTPARSGGDARTVFKLGLAVSKLELQLGFEGYDVTPLLQCNVTDFNMNIDVHPETLLLRAKLGDVQVVDHNLAVDNPYRQSCGLRNDACESLITTEFRMHSVQESYREPRVPDGVQYCSLRADMQAVTIVYLNRFLSEFLAYVSGLFHFCPQELADSIPATAEAVPTPVAAASRKSFESYTGHTHDATASLDAISRDLHGKNADLIKQLAFAVLLDVEMNAPVIEMPRNSESKDSLEVDLGVLTLTNRIVSIGPGQLVDLMEVTLQQVNARVLSGPNKGRNLIRELDQSLSVTIVRALVDPTLTIPFVDCHIEVPCVLACVSDTEYDFCTTVSLENLREPMRLPATALWVQELIDKAAGSAKYSEQPEESPDDTKLPELPPGADAVSSQIRATLNFGKVELEVTNEHEGRDPTQLALLHASKLFISYVSNGPGHMDVRICLPRLEAHDLRETRAASSSLVLSSSSQTPTVADTINLVGPSLLTLEYSLDPRGGQDIVVRLQRPTLVAEVDFLIAALKFVVPSLTLSAEPVPYAMRDTHLTEAVLVAEDHLWLSPTNRLLADDISHSIYVYDGAGHSIILPPNLDPTNELPLIAIGSDVTLQFKNVNIYNSQSLPACLSLSPGASMMAREEDEVMMLDFAPVDMQDPMPERAVGQVQGICTSAATKSPQSAEHLQIDFTAVGAGLHVLACEMSQPSIKKTEQEVPLLAVYTDIQATYGCGAGKKETASLCLKGLRMESQITSSEQGSVTDVVSHLHGGILRHGAGITQGNVLEPMDMTAAYKNDGEKHDVAIEITKVLVNVSPDVLTILSDVSDTILRPVQSASATQPLHAVNKYQRICSSHHRKSTTPPFASIGSGGLDFMGQEKGFTFWAPACPPGHGILGHLLTSGHSQPTHQVVCIALNSGFVKWPLRFVRRWKADTAVVWEAVPPPDYVALGCMVTMGAEPLVQSMVCVHRRVLVQAPLGECLVRTGDGCLWAIDNAAATFLCSENNDGLPCVSCFDLRSPLGASQPPSVLQMQMPADVEHRSCAYSTQSGLQSYKGHQHFQERWSSSLQQAQAASVVSSTVVFDRVWSNKQRSPSRQNAVSIWRPIPAHGYVALGDCLVSGSWAAPKSVTVLQVDDMTDQPLVAPAKDFQKVWRDDDSRSSLTVWKPVAHPGYAALGMVATTDGRPPPSFTAYCVRNDLFSMTTDPPFINVNVTAQSEDSFGPPHSSVSLCVFDRALQTLQWRPTVATSHPCPVLDLSGTVPTTPIESPKLQPFSVHINVSSVCVRVRDILRVPLLEVETSQVLSECEMRPNGLLSGNASCSPEIWSYNAPLKTWEQVMAPVGLQAQVSHEGGSPHAAPSADAGTSLSVSVNSAMHLTCTYAALDSILRALAWWRNAAAGSDRGALHRHAAAADNAVVLTEVHNAVGEPLKMWMDFGDRTSVADLAKGVQRLMQPLVRPVPRVLDAASVEETHRPTMLISITLDSFDHVADRSAADVTKESFFTIAITSVSAGSRVARMVVDGAQAVTCTRCLRHANANGSVAVRETFLLELPHGVASALANDVNAELRRRRTRSGSAAQPQLHNALKVVIRLHDQKLQGIKGGQAGLRATGEYVLESSALRDAALKSLETSLSREVAVDGLQANVPLHAVRQECFDDQHTGENVSIRMQLQRVSSWVDDAPDAAELSQSKSQRGNRSLRMAGADMRWQPIVQDGMKQASTGSDALSGSMLGLDLMSGLVLEESFTAGVRRETVRSSVRLLNSLDFIIEVAVKVAPGSPILLRLDGRLPSGGLSRGTSLSGAEQLQARSMGGRDTLQATAAVSSAPEVMQDEVLENERSLPFKGFKSSHLMALDPRRYSKLRNGSNSSTQFPIVNPPSGWSWQGPWRVERGPNTDADGWSYAVDFSLLSYPFHNGSGKRSMAHFVRRRRWLRQRCHDLSTTHATHDSSSRAHKSQPPPPSDPLVSLGTLAPGERMMIPLVVLEAAAELKVRPRNLLGHEGDSDTSHCIHAWSKGASNGSHTLIFDIDALDATTNRLLQCVRLSHPAEAATRQMPAETSAASAAPQELQCNPADLHANDVFFSLSVDAQRLDNAGPSETDWTVKLSAPLFVHNLLPVPADYIMFELPGLSGSANVPRQTGEVRAGGQVAVYAADVRTQVSLKFVPLGYQWSSPTAATLSAGYSSPSAGVGGHQALPTTLPLSNGNTKTTLHVHIERELDMLLDDDQQSKDPDPGAEIAMGCSMLVRIFVPYWVLNLTQVLVSTALVERPAPQTLQTQATARQMAYGTDKSRSGPDRTEAHIAAPLRLDTVECSKSHGGGVAPASAASHCQVLPGACELLSYTAGQANSNKSTEVVLFVHAIGSTWSPGLVLTAPGEVAGTREDPISLAGESLRDGRPVLLRAYVPENGMVLDVVAHLQAAPAPFQRCKILQLTPHIAITNRTGVPLKLKHVFPARPNSTPSGRSIMLTAQSHGELLLASPLPEITDNASERLLPAGVVGVPLHFGRKQSRTFAISMLEDGDASWSPPVTVHYPGTPELFVPVPLPAESSTITDSGDLGDAPQASTAPMERQPSLAAARPSKALLRRSAIVHQERQEQLAAVMRVSMQVHSPGCLHIILHTIGCQAPYLLQNRTAAAFVYRQHNTLDRWRLLPAYSSVGYAWAHVDGAKRLEVARADKVDSMVRITLESDQQHSLVADTSELTHLIVKHEGEHHEYLLHVHSLVDGVLEANGISHVAGPTGGSGRLGTTGLDNTLVISELTQPLPRMSERLVSMQLQRRAPLAMRTALTLAAVDISIVDHVPEELLLLYAANVNASSELNVGAAARFSRASLTIGHIQVDDQLWGTPFPVMLCALPSDGPRSSAPPALEFHMLIEKSATSGRRRMPYMTLDIPCRLRLALSETACWRIFDVARALPLDVVSSSAATSVAAGAPTTAQEQERPAVDAMLIIGLLSLGSVGGTLNLRSDPRSRPRDAHLFVSAAALSMLPEALDSVRIKLEAREVSGVSMRASQLWAIIEDQLRAEVLNIGFSLLYSYLGYFGTSAVGQGLSAVSSGLKMVAGVSEAGASSSAPVANITEGVSKGAASVAKGLFKGLKGVYQQPLEGAKDGATGFMKGLGHGLAGVVAMPLAGAMDLGASTMQGVNASITTALQGTTTAGVSRRRIQRAVSPTGAVIPFEFERSLAHGLLRLTAMSPGAAKRRFSSRRRRNLRSKSRATSEGQLDSYYVLPNGHVALLTNQGILLLRAQAFVALYQQLRTPSASAQFQGLEPGEVVWSLQWVEVLAPELRGKPGSLADHVSLHMRVPAPPYDIKCSSPAQAQQLLHAVQRQLVSLLHVRIMNTDVSGTSIEDAATPLEQGQALPFKMPCMEWRLVCITPRSDHTHDEASIWRPYGAPRYCSLGDVLRKGREPPSHPVAMYLSNQHSKRGGESPFVHPVHYLLVWREFNGGGITIWRGQPPEGYHAVGCVASKGLSPPPNSAMACIRKDLIAEADCWNAPTWRCSSTDEMGWRISCWNIDSPSGTFWAMRAHPDTKPTVYDIDERLVAQAAEEEH